MSVERLRFKDENGNNFLDWKNLYLGDISKITTGRLDANAMKPFGEYKFFTCAKEVFRINDYAFDTEALLISGNGANVGYIHYYNGKFNAYQRTYIIDQFKLNVFFLRHFLEIKLKNRIAIERRDGNTPYITMSTLTKMKIQAPDSNKEQEKIGNFLSLFDRLIEKLETKVGLLKELKKGYLQQLFPAKGEKVPKIRFSGFEEDWFEYQLGDISTRITRKNNVDNQNTLTISGSQGLVSQEEYFSKRVASSDLKNYTLIYKNDFAYNKSYSNGYPMGAIKRLNKYEIGVVSSLYICFKLTEKIDNNFIESYFDTGLTNEQLTRVSAEGARNHGLLNISPQDFFSIKISTPDFLEQEKIGDFFKSLDSLIEKQEKELNSIEQLKKGYMQRLFA